LLINLSTLIIPILDYVGDHSELMLTSKTIASLIITRKITDNELKYYKVEN